MGLAIDQVSDSTDLLAVAGRARHLRSLYTGATYPGVHGDP